MFEIRRPEDDELCGHVAPAGDQDWNALTVFGGHLGQFPDAESAQAYVLEHGLASLAEHWSYRAPGGEWQVCCIQEARPGWVRLALDYFSMPGVPVVVITADDLAAGHRLVLGTADTNN